MKYKIKVYNIMHPGQRKDAEGNPHQEDSIYPAMGHATDADRLFILCDGMGGHDAGEVASATVCEAMSETILEHLPDTEGAFPQEVFYRAIDHAYAQLDKCDSGAEKKMGTTMTMLKLYDQGAIIAHMGDSRVYHIRPGRDAQSTQILFQTHDHSLVNELIDAGQLTPEEAKTSSVRNVITRAMQPHMDNPMFPDVKKVTDIRPGDIFYMCSDGMLENMEDPQICYNFSDDAGSDDKKVKNLTYATRENKDNHTAIIVRVVDVMRDEPEPQLAPDLDVPQASQAEEPQAPQSVEPEAKPATPQAKGGFWRGIFSTAVIVAICVALAVFFMPRCTTAHAQKRHFVYKSGHFAQKPINHLDIGEVLY